MTNPQILIVEDNPVPNLDIKNLFKGLKYPNPKVIKSTKDVSRIVKYSKPDIILLDVELLGKLDALPFAKSIKKENIPLILISSANNDSDSVHVEVNNIKPYAYLVKPVNATSLESIIKSALSCWPHLCEPKQEKEKAKVLDAFFIKVANKLVKLNVSDILAVEAEGNYCTFYTRDKKLAIKSSLTKVKQKMDNAPFFQIHRNYIIQSSKITSVSLTTNEVIIGTYRFPIGGKYRSDFFAQLTRF